MHELPISLLVAKDTTSDVDDNKWAKDSRVGMGELAILILVEANHVPFADVCPGHFAHGSLLGLVVTASSISSSASALDKRLSTSALDRNRVLRPLVAWAIAAARTWLCRMIFMMRSSLDGRSRVTRWYIP